MGFPRDEADIKSRLMRQLRVLLPAAVMFRHEDKLTSGVPDISVTWNRLTSWWEVKYIRKGERVMKASVRQDVTMLRLEHTCVARYLLFDVESDAVYVAKPSHVIDRLTGERVNVWRTESPSVSGFDYTQVAQTIRGAHT